MVALPYSYMFGKSNQSLNDKKLKTLEKSRVFSACSIKGRHCGCFELSDTNKMCLKTEDFFNHIRFYPLILTVKIEFKNFNTLIYSCVPPVSILNTLFLCLTINFEENKLELPL